MFAVVSPAGKIFAVVANMRKALQMAHRASMRKSRTYNVVPWTN